MLHVVLYGCQARFLTLRKFGNRVLRKLLGLSGIRQKERGENYIMSSLMICTAHQMLLG